jgi:hypothetical protein
MTARRICKFYVLLNGVNDVAYFGFVVLQYYLLEPTLRALLPQGMSVWVTMTLITSQLFFQILAEGPTGAYADQFGRAWAVAMSFWCRLGAIGIIVACVLAGLTPQSHTAAVLTVAALLIVAQVLMATGEAFLEGSIEAWLTNECKHATPERWVIRVNKAFDDSAIIQNCAILVAYAAVLTTWRLWGRTGGIALAVMAGCLFWIAALVAHWLAAREANNGSDKEAAVGVGGDAAESVSARARRLTALKAKLSEAYAAVVQSEDGAVRRVIAIIVLPFPGWVILSWFYTAIVQSDGSADAAPSAETYALWLGLTLGVARVLGAWAGKRLGRGGSGSQGLQMVFEKAVLVNVIFLFGAALLLVVRHLLGGVSSGFVIALFFPIVALAKGSEEVIKLSRNKLLASILPNDETRATTLSFVSAAQNAFGFAAITVSGTLAYIFTDVSARQPAIIFLVCATGGVLGWLIYRRSKVLSGRSMGSGDRKSVPVP